MADTSTLFVTPEFAAIPSLQAERGQYPFADSAGRHLPGNIESGLPELGVDVSRASAIVSANID